MMGNPSLGPLVRGSIHVMRTWPRRLWLDAPPARWGRSRRGPKDEHYVPVKPEGIRAAAILAA
eukprot:2277792-Lingulodinium_polyedra.AAC.1